MCDCLMYVVNIEYQNKVISVLIITAKQFISYSNDQILYRMLLITNKELSILNI